MKMDEETKQKIYSDKEKLIESELERTKDIMSKMLDKLPNEELPFMEPHLRSLYFETYFLLAEGFYNASLVLCGILLENLVKEKLFMEGIKDEELEGNLTFGSAIKKCGEMKLLTDGELKFLEDRKLKLRNPYAHYNKMKLSQGVYFPVGKIDNFIGKIIPILERVNKGELTEGGARQELFKDVKLEPKSSEEYRFIAQIVKSEIDKEQAIPIFLEIDKFIRDFAEKYFKPNER